MKVLFQPLVGEPFDCDVTLHAPPGGALQFPPVWEIADWPPIDLFNPNPPKNVRRRVFTRELNDAGEVFYREVPS